MQLGSLVTSEELRLRLSAAFGSDRFPNAALLEGGTAEERRELALTLGRAALCSGEGERPCGQCPNCIKALAGSHPDLRVEGATKQFRVKQVKVLRPGKGKKLSSEDLEKLKNLEKN